MPPKKYSYVLKWVGRMRLNLETRQKKRIAKSFGIVIAPNRIQYHSKKFFVTTTFNTKKIISKCPIQQEI